LKSVWGYTCYNHIRRYGPPLSLRWGTWLYICVFSVP